MLVRPAKPDDVSLIWQLIHELAVYEKLENVMSSTEEDLRSTLFGSNPYAEVLLAFVDDQAAGFALFFHNYSTFKGKPGIYLEDLFVRPEFRGKGAGKELFRGVARIANERNCARMEWAVLDWNKLAIDFYEKLNASPLSDWILYRLDGEGLKQVGA